MLKFAGVWKELASTGPSFGSNGPIALALMQRVADGDDEGTLGVWLTFFGPKDAKLLLEEFGDMCRFANVLYGDWAWKWDEGPLLWWWEAEALRNSCLTVLSAETFHEIHIEIVNLPEGTKPPWADVPNYTVMSLAEGFFKSLDPPSARALRPSLDPEGVESYVISIMLGQTGCVAERIRNSFGRVMSYDLKSSSPAPNKVSDKEISKLCSLWLRSYFGRLPLKDRGCHSILKREIAEVLLPKPYDPT